MPRSRHNPGSQIWELKFDQVYRDDLRRCADETTLGCICNCWVNRVDEFSGHVLIIEDEPIIALELELLLGELGFRSFSVADTPDGALDSARSQRPDLITADYRITAGTGLEAVGLISSALGHIPVVYVTGNPDVLDGEPKQSIVEKPISARSLRQACGFAIGSQPGR